MTDAPSTPPKPASEMPELDWSTEPPALHVNGALINHSGAEFAIIFTDSRVPAANRPPRMVASLRMTPDHFFHVACAVAQNWNTFVENQPDASWQQLKLKLPDLVDNAKAPKRSEQ